MNKNRHNHGRLAALAGAILLAAVPMTVEASNTFGSLSNFDVFNDTGEPCHGFEIELEGLSSADVVYTFGAPYERYGDPVVEDYPGGVHVRYMSPWDAGSGTFTQTTPMAPAVITPTDGHACWTGGSGNYLTSGCEHFGLSLNGNPVKTTYRWLVADPAVPGALKPAGTQVSIPAPLWNLQPPPPAAPDQVNPVVVAVIEAPEPVALEYGEPQWVKVYVTESPDPADLDHLLSDDPAVPQEGVEVETEWQLLQSRVGFPPQKLEGANQIADGNESVTRRYEFYEYVGPIDPESGEATPVSDSHALPEEIGNYIGAQMAAINLRGAVAPPSSTSTTSTTNTTSTTVVADIDGDGVTDDIDNCVDLANVDQADLDGDTSGDVCDAADATITIRSVSLKAKSGGVSGTAKGTLVLASPDALDASEGFEVELADAGVQGATYGFAPSDCTTTNGRVRCRAADKSAQLMLTPGKSGGAVQWLIQARGAAMAGGFTGPVSARISQAAAIDRTGSASVCKTSATGVACR
jgi:hypothetical protein